MGKYLRNLENMPFFVKMYILMFIFLLFLAPTHFVQLGISFVFVILVVAMYSFAGKNKKINKKE
jgi:hypothetical protein